MTRFFTSKYPVIYGVDKDGIQQKLPVGTVFIVVGINSGAFQLEPVEKTSPLIKYPILVSDGMLSSGFTGQDYLSE